MVTAAHCYGVFANSDIYLGTTQLNGDDAIDTKTALQEFPHPYFDRFSGVNDIMLVKLDSASTVVTPKAWNTDASVPVNGDDVTAIGFGLTELELPSLNLLQVGLSIVDPDTCAAGYIPGMVVPDIEVCAGAPAGNDNNSVCQGDS